MFTIKWPRLATAACECAPYVSQVFDAELKQVLPFFLYPHISFPCNFSLSVACFPAAEICVFADNSHTWTERIGLFGDKLKTVQFTYHWQNLGLALEQTGTVASHWKRDCVAIKIKAINKAKTTVKSFLAALLPKMLQPTIATHKIRQEVVNRITHYTVNN